MIAKLTGTVVHIRPLSIVLDVHGVGYLVATTSTSGYVLNEEVNIHTYLAVRENALDLYGFKTLEEHTMFETLIKLPKIGPKTALQILSQADVQTIRTAVRMQDPDHLTKMSGIGKKSAEKIVLGLKDMIDDLDFTDTTVTHGDRDVIDALIALGYSQKDAQNALQKIPETVTETHDRIKHALKYVSG
jgi:holliday junction DNA helicase RuvA